MSTPDRMVRTIIGGFVQDSDGKWWTHVDGWARVDTASPAFRDALQHDTKWRLVRAAQSRRFLGES